MSWSYSNDPSESPLDAARFLLGDTDEENPIFEDEEIQYMIDLYPNENERYYKLFSVAATKFARTIKRSLGPQSEDPSSRLNFFQSMAQQYKDALGSIGFSRPMYAAPKIFYKGMMHNPPYNRKKRWP